MPTRFDWNLALYTALARGRPLMLILAQQGRAQWILWIRQFRA